MQDGDEQASVSVIIVSWNARDYLVQCLNSLAHDACRYPIETIVVDNASTDGSPEQVKKLFPWVRLARNTTNVGFARANNVGATLGKSRYLCFVNSDVKVLRNCITQLVDYCEEHPDVGMAGPRVVGSDGKLQRSYWKFPGLWNTLCRALALDSVFVSKNLTADLPSQEPRPVNVLSGCFWLVRRDALKDVGLLDENFFMYGEDMDWCRRFWTSGWKVMFVPVAEAIHYGGASSANAPLRFFIEKQKADLQYWRKHHPRTVAFYAFIFCLHMVLRLVGYGFAYVFLKQRRKDSWFKIRRSLAGLKWIFTGRTPGAETS